MSILQPGRTCWRITRADRLAFLVDGAAYFGAFRRALLRAQRSVLIVGWDVDSRLRLCPDDPPPDGRPATLLPFLNAVLAERPDLHVHVLVWDFSMIYTFEREMLPAYKFGWRGHRRLHFALDANHLQWASHHEKVVVVDDRVAFVGGLDLTLRRWDTAAHAGHDSRRVDPRGVGYGPIHDLQMVVDGETAAALGTLARQRWLSATGETWPATSVEGDPWPDVVPDLGPADVGIARTAADELRGTHVKEIQALTMRAIAAARRTIFIENQFLTSTAVGEALAARLQEADGPEVVLILPRLESGWLEQSSMGILRARLLDRLRQADRHGRLHVLHPVVPDLDGGHLNVHSKLLIVDERFLKLGSANLSNRSMGLDTECDLALEASEGETGAATSHAIVAFRTRLLAEHLGTAPDLVEQEVAAHGVAGAIARLRGGPRSLEPLDGATTPVVNLTKVLDGWVCDPDRPIAAQELIDEFVPDVSQSPAQRALLGLGAVLVAVLTAAALWRLSPFVRWLGGAGLASGSWLRDHRAAPLWVLAMFVVGALVFFPTIVLVAVTVLIFGFPIGVVYAWVASLVASTVSYLVGRFLPRKEVRGRWPTQTMWLRGQLRRRGFRAIVLARLVPVGSFAVINVVAGSLRVPFARFLFGNAVGLVPSVLVMALFTNRIAATLRAPGVENLAQLAALVVVALSALSWLGRRLARVSSRSIAAGAAS